MGILRRLAVLGAALPCLLRAAPAAAQPHSLRWDPALDAAVTAGGAAFWLTTELLKGEIAPARCRWCDVDAADGAVRGELLWGDTGAADALSTVTGFVLVPLASVGMTALAAAHDGAAGNAGEDTLLVAEAWVVSAAVTQVVKLATGRERPFVHALAPDRKALTAQPSDNDLSFFSGHTSGAFSLAVASATVSAMRGYRWASWAWAPGVTLAATTAYLRITADKHWLSDVVAGALVGAAVGFAVPYCFHAAEGDPPRTSSVTSLRAPAAPSWTLLSLGW